MTETRSRLTRQPGGNDLGLGGRGLSRTAVTEAAGKPVEDADAESDVEEELAERLQSIRGVGPATIKRIAGEYLTLEELELVEDVRAVLEELGVREDVAERVAVELDGGERRDVSDDDDTVETDGVADDPLLAQLTMQPEESNEPVETGRTQQVRIDYQTYKRLRAAVARIEAEGRNAPTMTEIATHALERWLDLLEAYIRADRGRDAS